MILQCLAKAADSRPPDAKALQQALRACAAVAPWSEEEAAHWWAAFRAAEVQSPKPVVQREGLTAVIDLAHRVNPWR